MPGYYLIGTPKCGTTILFYAMLKHPLNCRPFGKEPHFWSAASSHHTEEFVREYSLKIGEMYRKCALNLAQPVPRDWFALPLSTPCKGVIAVLHASAFPVPCQGRH